MFYTGALSSLPPVPPFLLSLSLARDPALTPAPTAGPHHPHLPAPRPVLLHKRAPWPALLAYLHTASALHTFHERFPADAARPDGDLAARFVRALRERVRELGLERARARGGAAEGKAEREQGKEQEEEGDEDAIDIEWPLALMLVKRV